MRALMRLGWARRGGLSSRTEAVTLALQRGIIPWLVLSPASDLQVGPTMERLDRTAAGPTFRSGAGRSPRGDSVVGQLAIERLPVQPQHSRGCGLVA